MSVRAIVMQLQVVVPVLTLQSLFISSLPVLTVDQKPPRLTIPSYVRTPQDMGEQ